MKQGNPELMSLGRDTCSHALRDMCSLARGAAEVVMSLAVIVMFGGLLAVREPDEVTAPDFGFAGDAGAQPA